MADKLPHYGQRLFTMRPKLEALSEVPKRYGKNIRDRRQFILNINDKMYADLLLNLERDGFENMTMFVRAILFLYIEDDPELRPVIRKIKKLIFAHLPEYDPDSKKEKELEASIKRQTAFKEKYGLSNKEIEDLYDILEKDLPDI